jgi:hypothetical protein
LAQVRRVIRFFRIGLATQVALVVVISACAYLGVLPSNIPAIPHLDWLGHGVLIGGLAFFADGALAHRPLAAGRGSLGGALVLAAAGFEEWAQRFSPRRTSTWGDFVADVVGVVLCVWLARRVGRAEVVAAAMAE